MRPYQPPANLTLNEEGRYWQAYLSREERELESTLEPLQRGRLIRVPEILGLSPAPEFPHDERGVYLAPFLSRRGSHIMYALDRAGRYAARLLLNDTRHWREVERTLAETLDRIDPAPIRLLR